MGVCHESGTEHAQTQWVFIMLGTESILELQKIIKEESGKEISFEEASQIAYDLVGGFDLLAKVNYRIESQNIETK